MGNSGGWTPARSIRSGPRKGTGIRRSSTIRRVHTTNGAQTGRTQPSTRNNIGLVEKTWYRLPQGGLKTFSPEFQGDRKAKRSTLGQTQYAPNDLCCGRNSFFLFFEPTGARLRMAGRKAEHPKSDSARLFVSIFNGRVGYCTGHRRWIRAGRDHSQFLRDESFQGEVCRLSLAALKRDNFLRPSRCQACQCGTAGPRQLQRVGV